MNLKTYINLGITSTKFPENTHLWWETNSSGIIYMVDSVDNTSLIKTTDKGANWVQVANRSKVIRSGWYDPGSGFIYFIEDDRGNDDITMWYLDTSDDSENTIGGDLGANDYEAVDIWIRDSKLEVLIQDTDVAPDNNIAKIYEWIDPNWTLKDDNLNIPGAGGLVFSYAFIAGTIMYITFDDTTVGDCTIMGWDGTDIFQATYIIDFSLNVDLNFRYMSYDGSNNLYLNLVKDGDGKNYLTIYNISGDSWTEAGEYNVMIMLDRNTASGVQEKGFHLTEYEIYQLQTHTTQLNLIAGPKTDAVIIAITDNFFMNDDGDMWEYEDQIGLLASVLIDHEVEEASQGVITLIKGSIPIVKNMLFKFYHNYTTAGGTSEELIFEGLVTNFNEDPTQTVTLVSPAKKEIKTILPEGSYTKDADGLLSQLIIDYNNYVTEGTLSDGDDLGTITLGGVHTEETIFDGCAKFDGFLWYFNPTGQLFYNNGTIDSGVNYSQADVLSGVNISHVHEEYNRIKVKGTYVKGVQVESDWQDDLESQQRLGINERVFLISFLNTIALCNIAASNILTILAKDPLRVKFTVKDTTKGYVQVGETITFEYAASGKTVASAQFIITSATINKYGDVRYTIVSELS